MKGVKISFSNEYNGICSDVLLLFMIIDLVSFFRNIYNYNVAAESIYIFLRSANHCCGLQANMIE